MSLEKELDKVLSEALPPRRDPPAAKPVVRKQPAAQPTSPQKQKNPDFAAARKAMRRPMVNLDAQIHQIDHMLNVTQKDPSQLGSTVQQIEKSFNALVDPLKQVRNGVQQLKTAAGEFNAEYVGEKEPAAPAPKGAPGVERNPEGDENRAINRAVTNVEAVTAEKDKLAAANQSWQEYQKSGGKMNRGEFYRALVRKLKAPSEKEAEETEKRKLPNVGATKRYGETGTRRGELQYKAGREVPIESSAQRRKMLAEVQDLGRLMPDDNEDRLINKIVTNIEMVNNPTDKQNALRDGWIEYQQAGGRMNRGEFIAALSRKVRFNT